MGDFNLDLLKSTTSKKISNFANILYDNSFRPLVDKPTGIAKTTASLIDNIFTNVQANIIKSGILYNDTTDHLPVFQITSRNYPNLYSHLRSKVRLKRCVNSQTLQSFKQALVSADWSNVLSMSDAESAYNAFLSKFMALYNKHIPLTKAVDKRKQIKKPWITCTMLRSINKKHRLFKKNI